MEQIDDENEVRAGERSCRQEPKSPHGATEAHCVVRSTHASNDFLREDVHGDGAYGVDGYGEAEEKGWCLQLFEVEEEEAEV